MSFITRIFGNVVGRHSTKAVGTTPVVDGEPISFEVWLDPSPAPWEYVPIQDDGPFRLVRSGPENMLRGYAESTDLTELVELFSRFHLPRREQMCTVLDRHANVLLGWSNTNEGTYWAGCRHGYGLFACYMPEEAAMAESMAVHASVLEIGEMFHHDIA